jgi:hypothetical protein
LIQINAGRSLVCRFDADLAQNKRAKKGAPMGVRQREHAMSTTDILLLIGFVVAFLAFGLVLAWGDFQTLDISRKSRERALSEADSTGHGAHH